MGHERDHASLAQAEAELRARGLLLASEERDKAVSVGCAPARASLWPGLNPSAESAPLSCYNEPWDKPQTIACDLASHMSGLASDASHTRVAMAANDSAMVQGTVRVCDVSSGKWKVVREISDAGFPMAVAISADGTRVAHASHRQVIVTSVADGKRLFACSSEPRRSLAIHPSGFWVAVCGNPLMLIGMQGSPEVRKLVVGGRFGLSLEDRETLTEEGVSEDSFDDELPMGREIVDCVGYSRDGKWIWCGTTGGLRVYDWNAVTRSSGTEMPAPVFSFIPARQSPPQADAFRLPQCSKGHSCDRRRA